MCFNCAIENVQLEKRMYETQTADLTWVFLHQIYTVTLTIIWALYNPEIRRQHPKHEVEDHIRCQIQLLISLAELWPGAEAAADLFARLAGAALRNYATDLKNSPASSHTSTSATPPHLYADQYSPPPHHASPYALSDGGDARSVSDTPSPHGGMTFVSSVYEHSILETTPPYPASTTSSSSAPTPSTHGHVPEPSYRDFQCMIFDPNSMNSMFQPAEMPHAGVPDWLQAWDPSAPALSPREQMDYAAQQHQQHQQQAQDAHYGEVLNQQNQHDDLMRILENEAVHEFDFSAEERPGRADGTRGWGYAAAGDGFF